MSNFAAKANKDQIDSIIRRMQTSPGANTTVRGGTTEPGTGPGNPPEIIDPTQDLDQHKSSEDHDSRYYTETELNNGQLDGRYYTKAEIDGMLAGSSFNYDLLTNGDTSDPQLLFDSNANVIWVEV